MNSSRPSNFSGNKRQLSKSLELTVATLAPGNVGTFGPEGRVGPNEQRYLLHELANEAYSLPASSHWICIDGRCSAREVQQTKIRQETADPQIAGSLPTTDVAVRLMADPETHQPVRFLYGEVTAQAIAQGQSVMMHGDQANGESGCAANTKCRDILLFMAENADVLIPSAWESCIKLGLDQHIDQDDLVHSILNAKAAATNGALWDATPEQCLAVALEHGAQYEEYAGLHYEVVDREDHTDRAFNKALFVRDHSTDGRTISAFSTSIGRYKVLCWQRTKNSHLAEHRAALDTARALLFNRAARKLLTTERTEVGLISYRI